MSKTDSFLKQIRDLEDQEKALTEQLTRLSKEREGLRKDLSRARVLEIIEPQLTITEVVLVTPNEKEHGYIRITLGDYEWVSQSEKSKFTSKTLRKMGMELNADNVVEFNGFTYNNTELLKLADKIDKASEKIMEWSKTNKI
jgi:hypothetical protein